MAEVIPQVQRRLCLLCAGQSSLRCFSQAPLREKASLLLLKTQGQEEGQLPLFGITPPIKLCRICASSRVWALSIGLTPRDLSKERAWTQCKCVQGKKRGKQSGPLGLHCNCTWICCFRPPAGSVGKFSWNQTRWGLQHQCRLHYELPRSSSDSAADGFCFLALCQPQSPEEQILVGFISSPEVAPSCSAGGNQKMGTACDLFSVQDNKQ